MTNEIRFVAVSVASPAGVRFVYPLADWLHIRPKGLPLYCNNVWFRLFFFFLIILFHLTQLLARAGNQIRDLHIILSAVLQ